MICQYCKKRLGIIQRLKGLSFCSLEHQELYFGLSFERLRDSVTEYTPYKPKPERPEAKPEPAQVELEQSQDNPVPPQPMSEQPQAETVVDVQASEAVEVISPTLGVASLAGAVGTTTGIDLPEAGFLPELPSRQHQPASALKTYAEPVIAAPVSPAQELGLRASPALVLDVSPVQPEVEVAAVESQATWLPVPEGYPPVVVTASATLLLDSNAAQLIALQMGEPCRGQGPVPPSPTAAIEALSPPPRLPSGHADSYPASLFARPPQLAACDPSWAPRIGSGYPAPALTGALYPQADVPRVAPLVTYQSSGSFSGFQFFIAPNIPVSSAETQIAPDAHLPATIIPRNTVSSEKPQATPGPWALENTARQFVVESATPLLSEPSFRQVTSTWLETAVAGQLPSIPTVPPQALSGLSLATDTIALECSNAMNVPPAVETAPAVTSALPCLLLSNPSPIAAPEMPSWSTTQPLSREACRLPVPVSEQQYAHSAAYLHLSSPSPSSLVTWSQSLSISGPACQPSDLNRPAPIALSARPGHVDALPPSSPSRRGQRLTPLKPQPTGVVWMPVAPIEASLQLPANEPIGPGSEGTEPPTLTAARAQPASMPVRPLAPSPFAMERQTGPVASGPCSDEALKLTSIDMTHAILNSVCGLRSESSAALPSLSTERQAFSIAMAPCSHRVEWGPAPPNQPESTVQPLSAVTRSACSVTASLPRTTALQAAITKVHRDFVLRKSPQP